MNARIRFRSNGETQCDSTTGHRLLILVALTLATLPSCIDDDLPVAAHDTNPIRFSVVGTSADVKSRAADDSHRFNVVGHGGDNLFVVSTDELNPIAPTATSRSRADGDDDTSDGDDTPTIGKFYVYAYTFQGTGDYVDNFGLASRYITEKATPSGTLWDTSSSHFWPGGDYRIKFFAYTPLEADTVNDAKRWPEIDYNSGRQNLDIMVAATEGDEDDPDSSDALPGDYNDVVNLNFYHALTSITVKATESLAARISKIEIRNIHTTGTHEFGSDSWTLFENKTDVELTEGEERMLLPQTLDDDAELVVTLTDNSVRQASLYDERWRMGRRIVYRISDEKVYTEFSLSIPADMTVSYAGNDNLADVVTSYVTILTDDGSGTVTQRVVESPWTATVKESTPWLTMTTSSGSGGTEAQPLTMAAEAAVATYTNERNDNLKRAATLAGIYDLSTNGGTTARTTANCYLVNAPGRYQLPLVFGNAVVNGKTNSKSYCPGTVNGSNESAKLKNFIDFRRNKITTPYIYDQEGNVPYDAILCWQDAPGLLTDVKLDDERHNLLFTVDHSTIVQGNALVAVRNSDGIILWSWHIWVTDYVLGTDLKSVSNNGVPDNASATATTAEFMPFNLGMCDNGTWKHMARSAYVTVTQTYGNLSHSADFAVTQQEHVFHPRSNTYYQWGRKDPMLPGEYEESGTEYSAKTDYYPIRAYNKKQYYTEDVYSYHTATTTEAYDPTQGIFVTADIATSIQNPMVFYINANKSSGLYHWCNWLAVNLWNGSNSGDVLKTVYDPCPPGFTIPSAKVFTGFTYDGNNVTVPISNPDSIATIFDDWVNSYQRSKEDFSRNFGFSFYCRLMPSKGTYDISGGTIDFPVIGYRPGDGSSDTPLDVGELSYTWSCNPDYASKSAWYMVFGITDDSIDLIPRTLGGDSSHLPVHLGNGFSVRPIKEY